MNNLSRPSHVLRVTHEERFEEEYMERQKSDIHVPTAEPLSFESDRSSVAGHLWVGHLWANHLWAGHLWTDHL